MYDTDNIYDVQWRLEEISNLAKCLRNGTYCASGIENYDEDSIEDTKRTLQKIHKRLEQIENILWVMEY